MSFKEKAIQFAMKTAIKLKEVSPEIALVAGVLGIGAGVVLACKATLKMEDILEAQEEKLQQITEAVEDETVEYTKEDGDEYASKLKLKNTVDIVKAYTPSALCIVGSLCLIFVSHKILRDRNTALMGAYSALATAFAAYRKRVVEYDGKDQDMKYLYGDREPHMVEEVHKNEDGTEEVVLVEKGGEDRYLLGSPYARIFDSDHSTVAYSIEQDPHNDLNFTVLKQAQSMFNNRLQMYGFVFLNDVLHHLGYEKVPEGQLVGWRKLGNGDGYIDFGIENCYVNPACRDIVEKDGFTRKIILDFNVDGLIYDKIGSGRPNELTEDELWALQNK